MGQWEDDDDGIAEEEEEEGTCQKVEIRFFSFLLKVARICFRNRKKEGRITSNVHLSKRWMCAWLVNTLESRQSGSCGGKKQNRAGFNSITEPSTSIQRKDTTSLQCISTRGPAAGAEQT